MRDWLKENLMIFIIAVFVTGVVSFWIHNSYRLAEVRAEVEGMIGKIVKIRRSE